MQEITKVISLKSGVLSSVGRVWFAGNHFTDSIIVHGTNVEVDINFQKGWICPKYSIDLDLISSQLSRAGVRYQVEEIS